MIAINLMPESISAAKQARSRAHQLLAILLVLGIAAATIVCGGWLVRCVGVKDAERRIALSDDIKSIQQTILNRKKQLEHEEQAAKQRYFVREKRAWVSQQMMEIVRFIPKYVTLSSLRIGERQILLSGVASKRSDVGELVSAIRLQDPTTDVAIEILKDIAFQRQILQEFVIRVARLGPLDRGLSDARSERREIHRVSD
jgi:Tfp pilus assembly protein PilN